MMIIEPMTEDTAKKIQTWQYDEPYSLYNLNGDSEVLSELLNGSYFLVTENNKLIGYFCFGKSAQVPAGYKENAYADSFLDFGLGLHPMYTGNGKGLRFVQAGLAYAYEKYSGKSVRLTVASFNKRAKIVYERAGFTYEQSFLKVSDSGSTTFEVMVKKIGK
ncbi:GNAT family N-acetyltransferase [Pseudalkalibacillus hwajinpoensis]|uniref:GNAT family N-acetyltransferase n=1 Tax=Guptibacillus hwajinpoensis TaxID=208199 RepID=UPI001CD1C229|nr:GNAT family N-acetyltransferase [Pseudalkalibacillus hwajinpoensis]MCA0989883.1 GNAT family N-acetyltransferase [Pseudalkalibacillus hwajinpoensis]